MREMTIKGKRKLVFVATDREAATIVIPVESLDSIDYKRLSEMEAKGGELMAVMRDTKLDNGMNALKQYSDLFVVVQKEKKPEPVAEPKKDTEASEPEVSEPKVTTSEQTEAKEEEKPKPRRGRGRRKKSES